MSVNGNGSDTGSARGSAQFSRTMSRNSDDVAALVAMARTLLRRGAAAPAMR